MFPNEHQLTSYYLNPYDIKLNPKDLYVDSLIIYEAHMNQSEEYKDQII